MSMHRWLNQWSAPDSTDLFDCDDDRDFPVRIALHCPFGRNRGWLLLGPRPDGSVYGTDDLDALAAIVPPLQRTIFSVVEREKELRVAKAGLKRLAARISELEAAIAENGYG